MQTYKRYFVLAALSRLLFGHNLFFIYWIFIMNIINSALQFLRIFSITRLQELSVIQALKISFQGQPAIFCYNFLIYYSICQIERNSKNTIFVSTTHVALFAHPSPYFQQTFSFCNNTATLCSDPSFTRPLHFFSPPSV